MAETVVPPTGRFQRAVWSYTRGTFQINMLRGEPYAQGYDSDSDEEVDVDDNHLQCFSTVAVNNVQRNDNRTPKNPDPAAVHSRRECSKPSNKTCHACGRFGHPAV